MQKIDAEKVQKYQDAINGAIRIHTKKATESLPYNKSELVEIVDITERNLGKYIVWNGSTRYYAYSENTTYDIGMKVYVNIPNSDFAAQKTIIGQYVADGEKSVVWRNPLDAFQPLPDINLLDDNNIGEYENKEYGLLANWDLTQSFPSKEYRENHQWTFPLSQEIILFESKKIAKIREDYETEKAEILANEELSEEDKNNQLKILDEEKINKLRNISSDLNSEYQGHTYLGITADFKTLLETFAPIDGDYGLRLEVFYHDKVSVMQDVEVKTRIYTLSAKNDMIGNVYNYKTYFTQASLFDISDIENIIGLRLYFFQSGDFKRNTNQWVPVYYSLGSEENNNYRESLLQNNIFVQNIKIKVGDDLISKNDRLRIKTLQGLTYSTTQNDAYNFKKIELEWDHLDPDADKFEILNKTLAHEKIVNYKIHWYKDAVLTASEPVDEIEPEEELNDDAWNNFKSNPTKENFDILKSTYHITNLYQADDYNINNNIVTLTLRGQDKIQLAVEKALEPPKKRQDSSTQIDNLAGKGWQSLTDDGDFIYDYFLPDTKKSYSKVMAIVEYNIESNTFDSSDPNYVIVKSNILEFTNETITSNPLSDDKNNALQITCEDGSNGDYPIYSGITRQLLSRADVSLKRNFKATCKSLSDGSNYLNGNETIIWKIPKFNTMIVINDSFIEESAHLLTATPHEEIPYDDNYYFIERSVNNGVDPVSDTQLYQIAPYFNKACVNNTIYCYIIKNNRVLPASKTLTFSQHGSSGTDYTFTLGFKQKVDNNWNVVGPADTALTIGDENYLEIDFRLFNSKNEEIELTLDQKNAIIEAWIDFKSSGYYSGLSFNDSENETDPIGNATNLDYLYDNNSGRVAVRIKPSVNDIGQLKYIVLQASVNSDVSDNDLGKIDFIQLLPIHVRAAGTSWILNGSDYIIYDDKGANPNFYNDAYSLTDGNNLLAAGFIVDWTGKELENISYYPKINNDRKLVPTPLYVKDITREIFIDCFDNNTVIYTCPLVILQNKYQIPAINKWNGELLIDSSGNKVLAAMVGAGHKNDDNTFSGVLMGDIEQEDPYDPGTKKEDTGLFGYDKGAQTFGFNVNGEAFIGASGTGRIYVNGNTGRITSAAREAHEIAVAKGDEIDPSLHQGNDELSEKELAYDPRGTDINLKDNYIDIQGIGNKAKIHIDSRGTENNQKHDYFAIDDTSGKPLMKINDDNYYLQTSNYPYTEVPTINSEGQVEIKQIPSGLKIDLMNGTFDSKDKITINGAVGSEIYFGNTDNHITLGINEDNKNSYFEMFRKKPDVKFVKNELDNYKTVLQKVFTYKDFVDNALVDVKKEITFNNTTYEITNKNPSLQEFINGFKHDEKGALTSRIAELNGLLDPYEGYFNLLQEERDAKINYWNTRNRYEEVKDNYENNYENNTYFSGLLERAQQKASQASQESTTATLNYTNYLNGDKTFDIENDGFIEGPSGEQIKVKAGTYNYVTADKEYNDVLAEKERVFMDYSYTIRDIQNKLSILEEDAPEREPLQTELNRLLNILGVTSNQALTDSFLYKEWQHFKNLDGTDLSVNYNPTWSDSGNNYYNSESEEYRLIINYIMAQIGLNYYLNRQNVAETALEQANQDLSAAQGQNDTFENEKDLVQTELNNLFNQVKALADSDLSLTIENEDGTEATYELIVTDSGVTTDDEATWGKLYKELKDIIKTKKNNWGEEASTNYNNYIAELEEKENRLDYLNNKSKEMQIALNDYNVLVQRYADANTGTSDDGYISINNNQDVRINVGNKFKVKADGSIEATSGVIGGWKILNDSLQSVDTSSNGTNYITNFYSKNQPSSNSVSINGSGKKTNWRININNKFGVDSQGNFYANAGKVGDAIINSKGELQITGLHLKNSAGTYVKYTPTKISVVTSVSLSTSKGSASIPYKYDKVTTQDKWVVSAVNTSGGGAAMWDPSASGMANTIHTQKEKVTYTTRKEQTGYVNFNYIKSVGLSYKTKTINVLAPSKESGSTSGGGISI